ncbi:hypothetical protein GCM10009775_01110 [Microbacterium aoyamense]|uniref:Uncharacterized protein n=1 Tax=Microbacterium aoyamense TaxID=344166 RepID=A0ABN2P4F6_9MICO|nr:hypothetical protein [Microbacterium aoyamense]
MTADPTDRLLAPYRAVRRVAAPADGPWSGVLVRTPAGVSGVLVEADSLTDDWAGWDAAADGHIAAPLDLVRTSHGHQVLLPVCGERLADFLTRRRDAGCPVSRGEAVTIGVSLVRAIAELGHRMHTTCGEWWLTDDRRPVFAADAGERGAADETIDVVRGLAAEASDLPWHLLDELLTRERISDRDCVRVEDELFSHAAAEPLADAPLAVRRSLATLSPGHPPLRVHEPDREHELAASGGWMDHLTRHVDVGLADAVSRATTGLWRRVSVRGSGRRRSPWLVAAAVGAVVLAGGLLWPATGAEPVAADPRASPSPAADGTPSPSADATGSTDGQSPAPEPAAAGDDLTGIVAELLSARTVCREETSCLADVVVPGADVFPEGVIDLDARERTLTIVDEFGGVAVLRADDASGALASQLIVVQQDGRRWLLRDVYVAQQP